MRLRANWLRLKKSNRISEPVRLAKRDGKFEIDGMGNWRSYLDDPYHFMLAIPWSGFFIIVALSYLTINALFAVMYLLGGDCLNGARTGSFIDAFFFSVQTFGSIGYGVISPKTTYANVIVTFEAIASLLTIAVVTGLTFARFSKPTARVVFSKYAVIASYNGIPTLMFRMANQRRNYILEAQTKVYLLRDEMTTEGEFYYRIRQLELLRSRSPSFSLTWTAMHPIDENSPLYGLTPEILEKTHTQLMVSLTGIDDVASYSLNLHHVYAAHEILFNHRLMDIIHKSPNGDRYFHYANFHKVVTIEADRTIPAEEEKHRQFGLS
jgi:inward rectifier potassium channel